MDLNEVLVFTQVVRTGSFTAAAKALGMQKSSVSRKVTDLEERLGVRLLQRTTRTLRLTEEGQLYYEQCTRGLAELEEAELRVTGSRSSPRGVLRVTAPLSFGFLGGAVAEYLEKNTEVQLELSCTDRVVDLVEEGYDVAIRAGHLADSSLIARRVGGLPRILVASPRYLKRRGTPKTPAELSRHSCIAFGPRLKTVWSLRSEDDQADVPIDARLAVNDFELIREAASAGLGITLIAGPFCAEALAKRELQQVLPAWSSPVMPVHTVYPSSRHLSSKVKRFVEVLQARMPGAKA